MALASALGGIVERIHDAALDEAQWPGAVAAIAETCGAATGILYEFDIARWESHIVGTHGMSAAFLEEYQQHYAALDPWSRRSLMSEVGRATCTRELISDPDLRRTEFYQDYLRRHDNLFYGLGGVIERTPRHIAILGVQRSYRTGIFDSECVAVIERIMPHLRQAYRTRAAMRQAQQVCVTLSETLHAMPMPVMILHGGGEIVFANLAAERLLAAGDGLRLRNGRVTAADRRQEWLFAAALARATRMRGGDPPRPPECILSRPHAEPPLVLNLAPVGSDFVAGDGSLVAVLIDPGPPSQPALARLQAALGLSSAEAALLQGLTGGKRLSEIAEARQVSVNTLRVQLHHLFRKTGTHRQAELVRLALTAAASRAGEPET
jgi:DNA-binding CsgD family transcriptional regulator/PAS domain-containing protein